MGLQVHWISVVEIMHGFFWILNLWQSQWVGNKWVWILIFSYYIGQFNLAAATQTLSSPSLLQDTPLMRYLYQRSQSGILGTTTKRSVWDTTTASNQLAVPIFRKKNLAVPLPSQLHTLIMSVMVWIMLICRLVDGAKCTRVWRWWRSEVQGTRFPSTVHGRAWSSSSTSCETSPCPSLLRASSRSRTCCVSLGLMNKAGLGKPSSHSPPHFQVDMYVSTCRSQSIIDVGQTLHSF